jgi:hypothetical protein
MATNTAKLLVAAEFLGVVVCVGLLYATVCWLAASRGWHQLAPEFRCADRPTGERWRWATVQVNDGTYHYVDVVIAEHVVYLRPRLLLFHPAIAIPWTAVRPGDPMGPREHGFHLRLSVKTREGVVTITISGSQAVEAIRKRIGGEA